MMTRDQQKRALQYKICMHKMAEQTVHTFEHDIIAPHHDQLNTALSLLLGKNYIPRPENGESPYDAILRNNRAVDMRDLQGSALINNPIAKTLDIKDTPLNRTIGYLASTRFKNLGNNLSPALNGDPVKATQNLHEGLQGGGIMGNFGRVSGISPEETRGVMEALGKNMYKQSREKLIGGLGDNKTDSSFPKKELKKGIKHETEHTSNKEIAKEIAKDHLSERNDYYTALHKAKIG